MQFWHEAYNQSLTKDYAVVTMVSTQGYVVAANVLYYSLQKHMDSQIFMQTDFIALLIQDHPAESNQQIMHELHKGWITCSVPLIKPGFDDAVTFDRFKEQFTKLHIWRLIMFKRVVYLDSDTMAVGDISPLLTAATLPFAAVRDWENFAIREHFNMGVCSLMPSGEEFNKLNHIRETKRDYRLEMAEQGMLNSLYKPGKYNEFPFEYNGNLAAAEQNPPFWNQHLPFLRVIHYTWVKPQSRGKTQGDSVMDKAIALWWEMKEQMDNSSLATELSLSRKVTIITALYNIKRSSTDERSMNTYKKWFRETLRLDSPMMIFVPKSLQEFVWSVRSGLSSPTRVIAADYFPYQMYLHRVESILKNKTYISKVKDPDRMECRLPLYSTLQFSKFEWLLQAVQLNPFNSKYFIWMDAGCSRFFPSSFPPSDGNWPSLEVLNSVHVPNTLLIQSGRDLASYNNSNTNLSHDSINLLFGTVFVGDQQIVRTLSAEMRKIWEVDMLANNVVNNEQIGLALLWRKNSSLFTLWVQQGEGRLPFFAYLLNRSSHHQSSY